MNQNVLMGALLGAILGATLVFGNFGEMLTVALFAAIGIIVVKVIQGDLDVGEMMSSSKRKPKQ